MGKCGELPGATLKRERGSISSPLWSKLSAIQEPELKENGFFI